MESLRTEESGTRKPKSWFNRNKLLVIASSTIVILGIIVGITLAIVLSTSDYEPYMIDSRIDCLPWLKDDANVDIEVECKKVSYCSYEFVKDKNVPSCYLKSGAFKVKIANQTDTELGENYYITYTNPTGSEKRLKLLFEYLDDNSLRFKVGDYE
jgi:hypothetical protein